mgnify:CR=1 FL=1
MLVVRWLPLSAAAAAYPAVLLLGGDPASQAAAIDAAKGRPAPKAESKPVLGFAQLVGAMRYRLASLKMDALPLDDDDEGAEASPPNHAAHPTDAQNVATAAAVMLYASSTQSREPVSFLPRLSPSVTRKTRSRARWRTRSRSFRRRERRA